MFIAMNRFKVKSGNADAFEEMWLGRDSHLEDVEGFVEFHLLRGPQVDGVVLYASHSVWESEQVFANWTRSAAFRQAHREAGNSRKLYEEAPCFEGFNVIQHLT